MGSLQISLLIEYNLVKKLIFFMSLFLLKGFSKKMKFVRMVSKKRG